MEDRVTAILQCTRWQEEEPVAASAAAASSSCRYGYSCLTAYPGDYPPAADLAAFSVATLSYTLALCFTFDYRHPRVMRLLSPSGPFLLPLILVVLSNGYRINTHFPLSQMGPVLLQLIHVSALAFNGPTDPHGTVRYAVLEASSASGVLHAAMYVDALVLPYYTGLDVLARSTPTGGCDTCVCRGDALAAGGEVVRYRGLSGTAACVAGTIVARLARGLLPAACGGFAGAVAAALEGAGWLMVARDCVYMVVGFGVVGSGERVGHGAVGLLVGVHVWRRVYELLGWMEVRYWRREVKEECHVAASRV